MKICMLLNNNFKNDSRVYREAKTLVNSGYEVVILAVKDKELPTDEVMEGIKVKRVLDYLLGLPLKPWRFKQTRDYVKKAILEDADFYHCHDLVTLLPGYLIKRKTHKKLIYDSHELYTETAPIFWQKSFFGKVRKQIERLLWKIAERFLIKKANAVIASNPSIAQELQKKYNLNKLPFVLRNLSEKKEARKTDKLAQLFNIRDKKIVLFQGGMTPGRGLENLVKAVKDFKEDTVLVLIGDGLLKADLERYVALNNLKKKVYFFKTVPLSELLNYTASADLGIIPFENICLNHYFCLPNKLFEYIQARLPVIASDFPEMKKIIESYNIGATFNPEDPKDITRSINEILGNPKKYQEYKNNLEKATQELNWEKEGKKLIKLYKNLEKK